ncbi:MAG: hypothetical protein JO307_20075 [Bryobacterales bacterium]|nr:hypothetical protein [Bryobacterales bacterium]MBV9400364.1 hypothetical protein [Bryobacterales bacterium]
MIEFIRENPDQIEDYLREEERLWQKFRETHPLPDQVLEAFRQADKTRV